METLETLQRRIAISRDLQSIVRTMKTLSAVTMRRSERASRAVRAYDETVGMGLQILLRDPEVAQLAIAASERAAHEGAGVIVLGSDHGLCGRFNDAAVRAALDEIQDLHEEKVMVSAVGGRAAELLESAGHRPTALFSTPGSVTGLRETTAALLSLIDDWQSARGIGRVRIVHTVETPDTPIRPVAVQILPISPGYLRHQAAKPWPSRRLPTYTEDREVVLAQLLREHVFVRIYRALAEAQASEHAARLAAMQGAEAGIRDHLEEMDAEYRRRRQEEITTEVLDIVAGATALGANR